MATRVGQDQCGQVGSNPGVEMDASRPASEPGVDELRARVAELEARNSELEATVGVQAEPKPTAGRRWRTVLAAVLIAVGAVFTPVAVITGWSVATLTDTDHFVATYAPLIHDPGVQDYLRDQVVTTIDERVDIDQLVSDFVTDLATLVADRPRAAAALPLLKAPAAEGIRSAITRVTDRVVRSEAFADTWQQALRVSHTQVIGALNGDPNVAATITADGLGLQLGAIVDRVRADLTQQGYELAASIPEVDRTIVLVPGSDLTRVQTWYRVGVAVGGWLPWAGVALLVAGVMAATNRRAALLGAGLSVAVAGGLLVAGLGIARAILPTVVPAAVMPATVLDTLFISVTSTLSDIAWAVAVLGLAVAVVCWWRGPSRSATRLRGGWQQTSDAVRTSRDAHGLATGRLGVWLARRRTWVIVAVTAAAVGFLLANRPLSAGEIAATALVAVAVLALAQLLEEAPQDAPSG